MNNFQPNFSHIYVEKGTADYALAQLALSKFPDAQVVEIDHYKDLFNRTRQDFQIQKTSMKLILAKKSEPLLYPASELVQEFGTPNVYYNTPILNCLYNCDYCFLQGMYNSGNMVVFVNEVDFFNSIELELKNLKQPSQPMLVSISYNTDLMAMEKIIPVSSRWIEFVRTKENLIIEIRTKSALFSSLNHLPYTHNVILSWTLTPSKICERYETSAPPLNSRVASIKSAMKAGWKVRLCFDPILFVDEWQQLYQSFFSYIFSEINASELLDVTLGVFRMNKDFFNRIRKREPRSDLFYDQYTFEGGILTVPKKERQAALKLLKNYISKYLPSDQILIWG